MKPQVPENELPGSERNYVPETPTLTHIRTDRPHTENVPTVLDDVSLAHHLGVKLKTLWWLVHANTYDRDEDQEDRHGAYNKIVIPKNDGSPRVLHEPKEPLKGVQKVLLERIFNKLDCPEYLGAYVPNRSPVDMAKRHVGYPVKLSVDLTDFFHWNHRNEVRDWLHDHVGYPRVVRDMIGTLVTAPKWKPKMESAVYVLPQGGPCSGMIANQIARHAIDEPILEYLNDLVGPANYVYSRYSDNIEISFEDFEPLTGMDRRPFKQTVVDKITDIVNRRNFWINEDKTKLIRKKDQRPLRVLGINVGEKLNIPSSVHDKLKAMAFNAKRYGLGSQAERAGMEHGRAFYDMLQSKLAYWEQVRPDKVKGPQQDLREAWEAYRNENAEDAA